jgi:hypothetical protein
VIDNQISNINIKIKVNCENSFIRKDKKIVSLSYPSIILFNKNSYDFNSIPNLYYGDNIPLYKNCKISEDKKYEIICSFSEDEIEKNFFLFKEPVPIFEIIPGCKQKIESEFLLEFDFSIKNCIKFYDDDKHICMRCKNKKYKVSYNGEKCLYSSYFYYICIGVPIINIALLVPFFLIIVLQLISFTKNEKIGIIISNIIAIFLFNILSFIPLYK